MSRFKGTLISLIVIVTFTVAVCTVQPRPAQATDTTTLIIILAGVFGGLAIFAIVMTLIVRNNPAWMSLGPLPDVTRREGLWGGGPPGGRPVKFGLDCGIRSEGVPLLCWR